jgi:hypothetical protein
VCRGNGPCPAIASHSTTPLSDGALRAAIGVGTLHADFLLHAQGKEEGANRYCADFFSCGLFFQPTKEWKEIDLKVIKGVFF